MEKGSPRAAFFVYEKTILQLYDEILHEKLGHSTAF